MEDVLKAIVLGVVEGLTEFLPVSSTGHLILVNQWVRFENPTFTTLFDIVIQFGAILAVLLIFWNKLNPFSPSKTPELRRDAWNLWGKAVVGTLPAVLATFAFYDWIETNLFNAWTVAFALIFYGVLFILVELGKRPVRFEGVKDIGYPIVLLIGLIQVLSMVPGTSRSGVTIIGALLLGVSRVAAAEFTFFLALPTIGGATLWSLYKYSKAGSLQFSSNELVALAVGLATSFAVAWIVIKLFLRFVSKNTFIPFGIYRIVLGIAVLAYFVTTGAAVYR